MGSELVSASLAAELDEALSLLQDYREEGRKSSPEPLPSLLEQCVSLCEQIAPPEPVRCLHHQACTGGTLLSKCIAALPNTILLSEIDPLSSLGVAGPGEKPHFAPSDLILALKHASRKVDREVIIAAFHASMESVVEALERRGLRIVLRDHSHSQFCTHVDAARRPTVREMLKDNFPVRSLVSVRHPLDSFLSLRNRGWIHFNPDTLPEYSLRVTAFLDRHEDCPLVRYEDFVHDPQQHLERICDYLTLPFEPLAIDLISAIRVSGDSGRSSPLISERPRRAVPEEVETERRSRSYTELCERLGYNP